MFRMRLDCVNRILTRWSSCWEAGKTSLAMTLKHLIAEDKGFMISGKFDQMEDNLQAAATTEVYSAFIEAFTHFIELCLTEESTLQCVKTALLGDMDSSELHVLQEMLPGLETLLGKHLQTSSTGGSSLLKGADVEDRVIHIFRMFVRSICSIGSPVVIFLDDVQWASQSALNLMANLLSPEDDGSNAPSGMLLCTCRTNLPEDHPVSAMLRDINDQGIDVTEIQVSNMDAEEVQQIVADTLHVPLTESQQLSDVLFRQSNGNLMFLIELIKMHFDDGSFKYVAGRWTWNIGKLQASSSHKSIHWLIEKKVQKLDIREQELLRIASCLGSSFAATTLSYVGVSTADEVIDFVQRAEALGIISFDSTSGTCRFVHDKVQQTVYCLTPESVREELHLNIGRQLRKSLPKELLTENVILVSHQVSLGIHLIHDQSEKLEVCELFFLAGQKAALASSFTTAASFLNLAISLLDRRHWRDHYSLSIRLYNFASELEYYNGNLPRFDEIVRAIIKHARCYDDTLVARFTQIYSLGSRGCMAEGIQESFNVLRSLGEILPGSPGIFHVVAGLIRCKILLYGKTDERILALPSLTDKKKEAAMRLLIYSIVFAFFAAGKHLPMIAFRLVKITMQNGMSEMGE